MKALMIGAAVVGVIVFFFTPVMTYSPCPGFPGAKCLWWVAKGSASNYLFGFGVYVTSTGHYDFEIPGYGSIPLS